MALGYRGNPQWRDMSEYVVHFVSGDEKQDGYQAIMGILSSGEVQARNAFGAARNLEALAGSQRSACFSEIPLDRLDRLVERRGTRYGIGFRQDTITAAGGGRVWYTDRDSVPERAVRELIQAALQGGIDPADPLWQITPFIDAPGEYGGVPYRFEWEREWRVPGGLHFPPDVVSFLMIPSKLHAAAREFFTQVRDENLGPAYCCPFVDPTWSDEQIQAALNELPV